VTCEQISGLTRLVRSNVQAAYENIALWHERDISHSSVERVILPDSCILVDYLVAKTTWLVRDMRVNTEFMRRNLDLTRGLVFSGQLLLDLSAAGMLREHAYKVVQTHAMHSWETGSDFRSSIQQDQEIRKYLNPKQIEDAFALSRQLRNVGNIFNRVFGAD
jgi:adenylosuccinate lyase